MSFFRRFWSAQRYNAVLYYVRKDIYSWDVDFVILLDLRQHRAVSELVSRSQSLAARVWLRETMTESV